MTKKLNLMDKIDEIRANSVTPEDFKETWGCSLEEHADNMMEFIHKLEAESATPASRKNAKRYGVTTEQIKSLAAQVTEALQTSRAEMGPKAQSDTKRGRDVKLPKATMSVRLDVMNHTSTSDELGNIAASLNTEKGVRRRRKGKI